MITDRDLLRHLDDGGPDLFAPPEPPSIDLAAITGQAEPARAARPVRRTWRLSPVLVVGGAAACLAIGLLGGATLLTDDAPLPKTVASTPPTTVAPTTPSSSTPAGTTTPRSRQVSLTRFGEAAPAEATAQANIFTATDGRTVNLRVSGLAQPRKGQFYELWVLGEGRRMISLGIVRVDGSGSADVQFPLPVSLRRFPVLDLSLEPGDGNPKHSGDSLLRSAAAA